MYLQEALVDGSTSAVSWFRCQGAIFADVENEQLGIVTEHRTQLTAEVGIVDVEQGLGSERRRVV